MDPCDHINPDASSSGRRYGNPVANFGTSNRTKVSQTSRCIWGQADKSRPRTHNHPLNNPFQEGELSSSRSAQGQWGKTNKYVGGISCASAKNSTLDAKRKRPSSYTARCQWTNEEVPPSDTYGKEESSFRSPWKNKNDCNSRNNVTAERTSGLPSENRLECRRSLFDIDYEAETELQTKDYHSGRNHKNVAESNLKGGSKSHDLVVVKTELEESHDFEKTVDYIAETGLRKRDLSPDLEHIAEPHPKKQNVESDKTLLLGERDDNSDSHLGNRDRQLEKTDCSSYGYPNKTQLEIKDNPDKKKQPEKREESVGTREALVSLVPGGATLSNLSIPQASEVQESSCEPSKRKRKRKTRPPRRFLMVLPSGERLRMMKSHAIALGLTGQKSEDVTPATGDKQSENLHDNNNGNKNDQLEKRDVPHTTDDNATKSRWDQKDNNEDNSDKDIINTWSFLEQLEKIKWFPHTTDDNATESRLDQKDNHQDKSDHDNSNINNWSFLEQLKKIKEVPHATDDNATKSRWDQKYNHRDENCHDKGKDTVQKGRKIDIFAIKRELEEEIRKVRTIKNLPAQISDHSNVQSNPTAATLLGSKKCDSNATPNTVTKTVSENPNNSDRQAVSRGQLHFNTAPKEVEAPHKNLPWISKYQNPLLPDPKKKPLDTLNRMGLKKHLAVKLMDEDGVDFLRALGDKTTLKITVEKQLIKGNICYSCIFSGPTGRHKLEAREAVERFLHPIESRNILETVTFKSDCSVMSLRENLTIIDSSDKHWAHLASLRYRIVLRTEKLLKTSMNIKNELNLVKEVQRNYSILNGMILGRLDVADGPKHMRILRQWLQQSNASSTMTSTIGFSFNYVFNYDSALEIDYVKVIKRLSNDRQLKEKLKISTMLHIGIDICIGRGWMERLKHHKSLYNAVIISNYSADSVEQFEKNYSQLKENIAKVTFKRNTTNNSHEFSADIDCSNFMIPNNQANLGAVQTYSGKEVPQETNLLAKAGGESKQEDDPHATDCATGGAVEVQSKPYLSGNSKLQKARNNINSYKWRKQDVALTNTPLQRRNPSANLLHFPHAQGVEPSQPPHGVNLASVALPYKVIPLPIMVPLAKKVNSFSLVPATAYKLFEAAGDDFLKTLCQQTNLNIDIIKDQSGSTVQYTCTLQGPNEEKSKAKAAIIKFCNGGDNVGS